jgi:hypothetical protein
VPGFEHIDLEIVLVALEGNADREVKVLGEDRNGVAGQNLDVLAVAGTVESR